MADLHICTTWLLALSIYHTHFAHCTDGPAGNPKAIPDPKRYTEVPWDEVKAQEATNVDSDPASRPELKPTFGSYRLGDHNAVIRTLCNGSWDPLNRLIGVVTQWILLMMFLVKLSSWQCRILAPRCHVPVSIRGHRMRRQSHYVGRWKTLRWDQRREPKARYHDFASGLGHFTRAAWLYMS